MLHLESVKMQLAQSLTSTEKYLTYQLPTVQIKL